jgi:hypothetical protein
VGIPLLAGLCALLLCLSPSAADVDPPVRTEYSRWSAFNIPFSAGDPRIVRVHLYAWDDTSRTWRWQTTAEPSKGHRWFEFQAGREGWYSFAVQTEDAARQLYPARMDATTPPSMKVCVDTEKPRVSMQGIAAPAGQAGLSWVVQDENLNTLRQGKPGTLQLEYRAAGRDTTWTAVNADQRAVGQALWSVPGIGLLEVRLRVADDAGNIGESAITITPGVAGGTAASLGAGPDARPLAGTAARPPLYTNNTRVNLKYSLHDVGKSGISVVEVWNTTDGRSWQLAKPWRDIPKDFDKPLGIPITFEREGLYGFTLIPRSGVGRGAPPPQPGDDAQVWIEYDKTPPAVRLISVEVGRGADEGKLLIAWSATDKNLDEHPITLSYAEDPKASWTPFARELANDGFYTWKMDTNVPFQFYVRAEARDRAGNVGKADTVERVKVDLNQPKANVSGIEPLSGSQ